MRNPTDVEVKIFGTRGSVPYADASTTVFGGNTSSYSVRTPDGTLFLLDAGSGLMSAQKEFFEEKPDRLVMLLSHGHQDHLTGLGLTAFPFMESNMQVYGPPGIANALEQWFAPPLFPVQLEHMKGIKDIETLRTGDSLDISSTQVDVTTGPHPNGGSNIYRLQGAGVSIVYATDIELDYVRTGPTAQKLTGAHEKPYRRIIHGADVLIADGQYTLDEYLNGNPVDVRGFGHMYPERLISLAGQEKVGNLVITHHSPTRTDKELREMELDAQQYARKHAPHTKVQFAREGDVYRL